MRSRSLVLGVTLLASACADTPLEAPLHGSSDGEPKLAATLAATSCTKNWASGIGGLWADPARWTPIGVPGPKDAVCIDVIGSYDILATQPIDVRSLVIGGDAVSVTFDFDPPVPGIGIETDDVLGVLPGSELNILSKGGVPLSGALLVNFGTIDIENVCACGGDVAIVAFDRIDNINRMELDAPMTIDAPLWTNGSVAVIVTSGQGVIDGLASSMEIRTWGQIVGSTQIHAASFDWRAGTVGESAPATSTVLVFGGPVDLSRATSDISGRLEMDTDSGTLVLDGSVPAEVTLEVFARGNDLIRMTTPSSGNAVLLDGSLSIKTVGQNVLEFDELVINGELTVNNLGALELRGDELVNEGTIKSWVAALTFPTAGGTLRNGGRIVTFRPATLTMGPLTDFVADGGSTESDLRLVLDDATLEGSGTMGAVVSLGGSIEPEMNAILSVDTVTLDANSELVTAFTRYQHGLLDVRSAATFDGTLRLRRIPFVAIGYGNCGDAMTAVRHTGVLPIGAFSSFVALNGGPRSNWRVGALPDSLMLAGYDLTQNVTVVPPDSIAFAVEGSAAARITVCLGPTPPSADVVLATTPIVGQLVAPVATTFDAMNWMIPATVYVAAVDDAVIEPPQSDTLTYALTSADPFYDLSLPDSTPAVVIDNDGSTDFDVVIQNAPDTVATGTVFEVVYRVTNNGPTLSTGSALIIGAQGGGAATFQEGFGATCYEHATYGVVCEIAGLAAGGQQVVAVVYQAGAAGDVSHQAMLYTHQPDADQTNNQVEAQLVVN